MAVTDPKHYSEAGALGKGWETGQVHTQALAESHSSIKDKECGGEGVRKTSHSRTFHQSENTRLWGESKSTRNRPGLRLFLRRETIDAHAG